MKLSIILEARLNKLWLDKQLGKGNPIIDRIIAVDPTGGEYYLWLCAIAKDRLAQQPHVAEAIASYVAEYPQIPWTFLDEEGGADHSFWGDNIDDATLRSNITFWDDNKVLARQLGIDLQLAQSNKLLKTLDVFLDDIERMKEHKAVQASKSVGSKVNYLSASYPGTEVIFNDGHYVIFKCEGTSKATVDSLERLGIGTNWCTRKGGISGRATLQLSDGPVYVVYLNKKPISQLSSEQFMDSDNNHMDLKKHELLQLVLSVVGPINADLREYVLFYKPDFKSASQHSHASLLHALDLFKRGEYTYDPSVERSILEDPLCAAEYAVAILGTAWPKAEPVILKDKNAIYRYLTVADWPEGESVIFGGTTFNEIITLLRYCSEIKGLSRSKQERKLAKLGSEEFKGFYIRMRFSYLFSNVSERAAEREMSRLESLFGFD
jgi:hypothetical protein